MKHIFLILSFSIFANGVVAAPLFNGKTIIPINQSPSSFMNPGAEATGGSITCVNSTVQLLGSSPTPGVVFLWSGPNGFVSDLPNPIVDIPGNYLLTVVDPVTGLSSSATAVVDVDMVIPDVSATGGTLSCSSIFVPIFGISSVPDAIYSWTGPNGFTSNAQAPFVGFPGTYSLTVTNPANGCEASADAEVDLLLSFPDVSATGGTINCINSSVQLMGNSSTPGVTFSWTGPAGFSSTDQNPVVDTEGLYYLTVFDPVSGCSAVEITFVQADTDPPGATATGGNLSCIDPLILLTAGSPTSGVTYQWSGPNGFTSETQSPLVTDPGNYDLTITNPANGCFSTATAIVTTDNVGPGAEAIGGTISAISPTIQLQGSSPTPGVLYTWLGTGGFFSQEQNPTVDYPGTFILTVVDPVTGCASVALADVQMVEEICITIDIALFLEGAYETGESQMSASLSIERGLLPGQTPSNPVVQPTPAGNPYRGAPWNYEGTTDEETYIGPYVNGLGQAVTDWVLVSFRTSPDADDQVAQAAGLLFQDGHVEFIKPCLFTTSGPSSYWIVVEHRNHIGIMTDSAVTVQNGVLHYDFRQTDSYASLASFGQKQVEPGVFCMFAADGDQNDFPGFDINGSDAFIWQQENGLFDGYFIGDFNLNGDVNGQDNFLQSANNGIFSIVPKD
ncbi:MAG: hypothetical protein AAF502_02805 [Bacteroidota bacterium]